MHVYFDMALSVNGCSYHIHGLHSAMDGGMMTPQEFIERWQHSTLKERSASQSHFNDLCALLGELPPTAADPKGE